MKNESKPKGNGSERKFAALHLEWESIFDHADDATAAALTRAIIKYTKYGTIPTIGGLGDALFQMMRETIDKDLRLGIGTKRVRERRSRYKASRASSTILSFVKPGSARKRKRAEFVERFIVNNEEFDVAAVSQIIKGLKYDEFLQTPYWKAISDYIKERAGRKCEICGSQSRIQTHHKTYLHHGDELHHLKDLECLCNKCHKSIHGL